MRSDLAAAVKAVEAVAARSDATRAELLIALTELRLVQEALTALEPALVTAARAAGVSWQDLAPALGVGSRQAAERRYLRSRPAAATTDGATQDERVRAERDRRAVTRAVAQWANDNTSDLRRLAGRVTALTDLSAGAAADVGRLHDALADPDAAALPGLLAEARQHLTDHPELAGLIDDIEAGADEIRRTAQERRVTP